MANYQRYAEYRDSGVEWLGEIPNHWINTKVKFEAYVKARVGWHGLKSDDFTDEGPYLVTGSDFQGTVIDWSQCYHCDLLRYEQDPYIQLKDGDLLITKDGTIGKVALVSNLNNDEKATLNSGIFVIRPLRHNFSTKFYFWLLQSKVFREFVDFNKTGSTIVHLYQDTFVNFEYASPALVDQIQIANFLDHETAKIDSLIEKQQQLIELLKEKRQAVISHAVTKGLDPSVQMKDSGVEWLGKIPSHWKTVFLKMIVDVRDGTHDTPAYVEPTIKSYPLVTSKDVTSGWIDLSECKHISESDYRSIIKRSKVSKGDILMPMIGTVGSPVIVKDELEIAIKNLALFRTSDENLKVYNKFLYYFLNSDECNIQFILEGRGGVQNFVSLGTLRNLQLPYLSLNEQIEIADFLDHETTEIDKLINKVKQQIQLMQERRTALISAAVTGKIDVRNWQAPNATEREMEVST